MDFVRKYIKDKNFVLTLVPDGFNEKSLVKHIHALTEETANMRPFLELADATQLFNITHLSEVSVAVAATQEFERLPYKQDRLAIVVSNDETENLAYKYRATSLYFRADVKIFRDIKKAVEWLGLTDIEEEINALRIR